MKKDFESILLTGEEIRLRTVELGRQISMDYASVDGLIAVCVLKGSILFIADLLRQITIPTVLDCLMASSYEGAESTGVVDVRLDLTQDIRGKHVLLVEDIVDTGRTIADIRNMLEQRHPASIALCSLLNKPERRKTEVKIDYLGFTIPNAFVVGYGLDYNGKYRGYPDIAVLKPEIYAK